MTPLPFRIRSSSSSSGENTDISLCSNIGTIILGLVLILCNQDFSFVVLVSFIDISNFIDRLSFFHWGFSFVVLIGFIDIGNLIHRLSFLLWWGHIWNFRHAFNRSFIFLGFSFSFLDGIFVLFFTFHRDVCVLVLLLPVFRCSFSEAYSVCLSSSGFSSSCISTSFSFSFSWVSSSSDSLSFLSFEAEDRLGFYLTGSVSTSGGACLTFSMILEDRLGVSPVPQSNSEICVHEH
ncbi:hypothetical protein Hanom_Chr15g01392461 [Helianthus anomalus]